MSLTPEFSLSDNPILNKKCFGPYSIIPDPLINIIIDYLKGYVLISREYVKYAIEQDPINFLHDEPIFKLHSNPNFGFALDLKLIPVNQINYNRLSHEYNPFMMTCPEKIVWDAIGKNHIPIKSKFKEFCLKQCTHPTQKEHIAKLYVYRADPVEDLLKFIERNSYQYAINTEFRSYCDQSIKYPDYIMNPQEPYMPSIM